MLHDIGHPDAGFTIQPHDDREFDRIRSHFGIGQWLRAKRTELLTIGTPVLLLAGVLGAALLFTEEDNQSSAERARAEVAATAQVLGSPERMRQLGVCIPELVTMREAVKAYSYLQVNHPGPEVYDAARANASLSCFPVAGNTNRYTSVGVDGAPAFTVTGETITSGYDIDAACRTGNTTAIDYAAKLPDSMTGLRTAAIALRAEYDKAC